MIAAARQSRAQRFSEAASGGGPDVPLATPSRNWTEVLPANSTFRRVFSCTCFGFFLVALVCPCWLEVCVPGGTKHLGPWQGCKAYVCRELLDTGFLKTVRLLLSAAMVTAVLALLPILLITALHLWDPILVSIFSGVASYLTAVLGLLAQFIFMTEVLLRAISHFIEVKFSWAFYLGFGVFTLYLLTGTLILVMGPISLDTVSQAQLPPHAYQMRMRRVVACTNL
ncbi:protein NKG7-like [Dasypus novemcinctus]|uniref:protein NKG7-like n=1 Tax=Dasypus novemcinctus TaxID=9361 RepID=UPI00265E7ADB|nr:protein NKG7-like [Dasypus novemcinctus]